ncbi:DUF2569 family protein [Providencia stuartii]|uniref:DUF2569 domain-containing protein n=1 Tax=Providencia stuartii ATCC 25827 TaxID=471874 RepID=A0AA87CT72_PROST|nr:MULTISPECIES: DUF2569 family protein [Providencia]EDU61682.1 hypothetical protein PROSTU_00218 [Providencia stuartii ATCC 25827]MBS7782995.1 DUF2569 domain-containing protein [Providencia thailandensis]MTC80981.1 DUF2569 family protein [Providencia stuartii]MTC92346.1 DUF2569 family protein [Providencia stuartii]OMH51129.1 hypothetical protein BTZ17_14170 [Providencia stuartii]
MDVNTPAVLTGPQKTPLQGIRGWLILPMLGLFYMLYQTIIMMYLDILQVKSAWHLVTNEQSDFYVDGFSNAFYMLQMAQGILIVLLAWNVIAAFKGLKIAKPLFIISMLFYTVMVVVSRFVFPNIFGIEIEYSYIINVVNSSFYCFIWIPYVLMSDRVKQTFIH